MSASHAVTLRIARTAAFLWAAVRASLGLLGLVLLSPLGVAALTPAVVALTWLELKVTGERLLYANLAVPPHLVTVVAVVVVLLLEFVTGSVLTHFASGAPAELLG